MASFLSLSVMCSSKFVHARRPENASAVALVPGEELLQPLVLMASGRLAAAVEPDQSRK
jgi:hypothetical protein